MAGVLGRVAAGLDTDPWEVVKLGRTHPDDPAEPFGVTQFALRTTRAANAVSRLFLEQWFTFPGFVISGRWLRAFRPMR